MANKAKRRGTKSVPRNAKYNGPNVYSYVRFSSGPQGLGGSTDRQEEAARRYAESIGIPFDQMMRMTDEALSGFTGANRKKGELKLFLEMVESGNVPRGSILVIEEIRRLTREHPLDAMQNIVLKLINDGGITIQTVGVGGAAYNRETISDNPHLFGTLLGKLQGAYDESLQKSDWSKKAREAERKDARENGAILTSMTPEWLEVEVKNDKIVPVIPFRAIKQAKTALKMMFQKREQRLGPAAIAKYLNQHAPWRPPADPRRRGKQQKAGWSDKYVHVLLRDRRLLGEHQPKIRKTIDGRQISVKEGEPWPNYYPAVIDPGLFARVQQINKDAKDSSKHGRNDKARNLFQGLTRCAYCGGPMYHKEAKPGAGYLYCQFGRVKIVECLDPNPAIRYETAEAAFLDGVRRIKPEEILPPRGEQQKRCKHLRERIETSEAEIKELAMQQKNLIGFVAASGGDRKRQERYDGAIKDLERQQQEKEKELVADREELSKAEAGAKSFEKWKRDLDTLKMELAKGNPELRQQVNAHLKKFIDYIEVFSNGHKHVYDEKLDDGDSFREQLDASLDESRIQLSRRQLKNFHKFVDWAIAKRATKKGGFVRVHFKHGPPKPADPKRLRHDFVRKHYIDIVPAGSWAGTPDRDIIQVMSKHFERETGNSFIFG